MDRGKAALCPAEGAAGCHRGPGKKPADFAVFLRLMEESGYVVKRGRGGAISFLVPGQQRATRLRSSTLGEGIEPGRSGM